MNKLNILTIIFLLSCSVSIAQYTWLHPEPQGNTINDLARTPETGSNTLFAVGDYGAILKSNDNGETWSMNDSVTSENLFGIAFNESGKGYIVGNNGKLLENDGGNAWISKSSFIHFKLNDVDFVDETTAFAVGHKGTILKILEDTCIGLSPVTFQELNAIEFVSATTGFIASDQGSIFRTTNGGNNWTEKVLNDSVYFYNLDFPSELVGFAIGKKGRIWKTTNGGDTWINITFPNVADDLRGIHFIDDTTGMISGRYGRIITTINGGNSWASFDSLTSLTFTRLDIYHSDTNCIKPVMVGESGTIFKQSDTCTWTNISGAVNFSINSIAFMDPQLGGPYETAYAVGGDYFTDKPFILKTENALTWDTITADTIRHFITDIAIAGDYTYICGYKGMMHGKNPNSEWGLMPTGTTKNLYAVTTVDQNYVFACGEKGTLLKSADYGQTWVQLDVPTFADVENLYGIGFANINKGYVVGSNGTILEIRNGGDQVLDVYSPTTSSLYDVDMYSPELGYAVGANGTAVKFTQVQGGDTVILINTGVTTPLNRVQTKDGDSVYMVGDNGIVLFSQYGGDTLFRQYSGTSNHLRALSVLSDKVTYVGGSALSILRTDNGGGGAYWPNDVEEIEFDADIPVLVYPNPTNGRVTIEYDLPHNAESSLQIYDLSGRLMAHVFRKKQPKGLTQVNFDVSHLTNGIYIMILYIDKNAFASKLIVTD